MHYLALLISSERELTPDEGAAEMAAYQDFHRHAASAIRAGDALAPVAAAAVMAHAPAPMRVSDSFHNRSVPTSKPFTAGPTR